MIQPLTSTSTISIEQTDPPRSPRETLPTMYDLPSEDPEEPGLPDEFHDLQPQLLSRTLCLAHYDSNNYFTASDLNLYYYLRRPLWYKRPDWFLAVNVPRLYDQTDFRRSYVIWQEQQPPHVVVEFLSPSSEAEDLGRFYQTSQSPSPTPLEAIASDSDTPPDKLRVYEQFLQVPHYIVYSRHTQQLRYFQLMGGQYQEQQMSPSNPMIWLSSLEIGLGIWQGEFEGIPIGCAGAIAKATGYITTPNESGKKKNRKDKQKSRHRHS
jgi:Uma2 family endonuclease